MSRARRQSSQSYDDLILATPGLQGYWPLGEASGTVANDRLGLNPGAYVATPTLGANGVCADGSKSVTLNGSTQWVTVTSATRLHPGDTFSLEIWAKRAASGVTHDMFRTTTSDYRFMYFSDNKLYLSKVGSTNVFVTTSTFTDALPHHLVATKTGASIAIYRDGVSLAGTLINATIVASAADITIGGVTGFNGSLQRPAIYNRALTPGEIWNHYAAGAGL